MNVELIYLTCMKVFSPLLFIPHFFNYTYPYFFLLNLFLFLYFLFRNKGLTKYIKTLIKRTSKQAIIFLIIIANN